MKTNKENKKVRSASQAQPGVVLQKKASYLTQGGVYGGPEGWHGKREK